MDGRISATPETPEELRTLLNNAIIGSNIPKNALFCSICGYSGSTTKLGLKVHMGRKHANVGVRKALMV